MRPTERKEREREREKEGERKTAEGRKGRADEEIILEADERDDRDGRTRAGRILETEGKQLMERRSHTCCLASFFPLCLLSRSDSLPPCSYLQSLLLSFTSFLSLHPLSFLPFSLIVSLFLSVPVPSICLAFVSHSAGMLSAFGWHSARPGAIR